MKINALDRIVEKYKSRYAPSDLSEEDGAKALDLMKEYAMAELQKPTHIAVIGKTGVGKTSTVNALFGTDWEISHVRAATKDEQVFIYENERGRLKISDLPGFGEDIETEDLHRDIYKRVLGECDVALLILKADTRDMLEVQRVLLDLADKNISKRIVVGLNQIDLVNPGDWLEQANIPSVAQEKNIEAIIKERTKSIRKVCWIKPSQVVAYSAEKRFRLETLFTAMVHCTVGEAWVLDAKKKIADYTELIDPKYLPANLKG
jgi:uncharacterized protein